MSNSLSAHPSAMASNDPVLTHWYYPPDEWERFFSGDWSRYSRQFWRSIRVTALRLLAAVVIVDVLVVILGGWLAAIFIFLCYGVVAGFFLSGLALLKFFSERIWYRRLLLVSPEITIRPDSVLFGATADPQMSLRKQLTGFGRAVNARVEEGDPPVLRIVVYRTNPGGVIEDLRIPIPQGQEEEAQAIAANEWT